MPVIFLSMMKITIIILLIIVATIVGLLIALRVKCPKCGGHMKMTDCTDTINIWTCQKCGHKITIEDYDE